MPSKYSYPHIEFNTVTVGVVPPISPWRNRLGVVGQFRRGPALRQITSVQDFTRLYGADRSPGARAVRMMLALGATDITISRAVSEESSSTFNLSLHALNAGGLARVGFEGQVQQYNNGTAVQTSGISVEANYIGEAIGSVGAFGKINVNPTSRLNKSLNYSGQSVIDLKVENRISNTVAVVTTSALTGNTRSYTVIGNSTFVAGATGPIATLNALLTPIAPATALGAGSGLAIAGGGFITCTATTFTVVVAGALVLGSVALATENLAVTNVLARLGAGSKLYSNNVEIATIIVSAVPTNNPATLIVVSTGGAAIPAGSTLRAQSLIGRGSITLIPTGIDGYQFARISKSLFGAIVANLSPGKVFQSNDSKVAFTQGGLTILSRVIEDPLDPNVFRIVVKGAAIGLAADLASGVNVAMHDTLSNGYTIAVSTTANLSSVTSPDAIQWRNQLFQESTRTLVDSYEIVSEAYKSDSLRVNFLFVNPTGTLTVVDSGIRFDLPAIESTGTIAFVEGTNYRIPVVRAQVNTGSLKINTPAFPIGTSAGSILDSLNTELLQDSIMNELFEPPIVSKTLTPVTLTINSRIKGVQANRIYVEISRATIGGDIINGFAANDLLFNNASVNLATTNWTLKAPGSTQQVPMYFRGGSEGSKSAFLDLYSADSNLLVKIVALSDGSYGNQIKVSISPGVDGQFVVNAIDLDSSTYQSTATSETLNLSTRDVDAATGLFNATSNSALIRAFYVPVLNNPVDQLTDLELSKVPVRIAPAFGQYLPSFNFIGSNTSPSIYSPAYQGSSYLNNLFLTQGADAALESDATPTAIGAQAMVRAVRRLETEDIAVLYPAGVVIGDSRYATVVEECLGQVNRMASINTNRRLVLQAPPNLNQDQAALYGAQLNNEDVSLIAGFCSYTGISTTNTEPAAALYAATISLISPPASPAYARNGVSISLVGSTDIVPTPQYLDALTRAGVDALFFDTGLGEYHWLNGRTTSRNPQKRLVSVRRVALQMQVDLYRNLVYIRSAQNDSQTRALVSSSCDAYLSSRVDGGWIQSSAPTICNESNNTPSSLAAGYLNVVIRYTPYFPSDIIIVDVIQDFSIQVGT